MKRIILAVAICLILVMVAVAVKSLLPRPPKEVGNLVAPILDARLRADDSQYEPGSPAWKVEELLDQLVKDRSASAGVASIILLDYYLGEHNGETELCAVTSRGTAVLPLVIRYREHPFGLLKPQYELLKLNRQERDFMYQQALESLRSGKPFGCD